MSELILAGVLGLGGNSLVDLLAPLYTCCVGALIYAKYLSEKEKAQDKMNDDDIVLSQPSAISGDYDANAPEKALPDLVESVTGLKLPGCLAVPLPTGGEPMSLCCVGVGPRIKKVAMLNIKVYALGVYVERSARARSALKAARASETTALFTALLHTEPFFVRALHLVFARAVTGKQVADALAERLKPKVEPAVFALFTTTLVNGIGAAGLQADETLTFVWAAPDDLRIVVRGRPAGDMTNPVLARMVHLGFLGDDPAIPELKPSIAKFIQRLFAEAPKRALSSGPTPRAAAVVRPASVTEPATGLVLPTTLGLAHDAGDLPMRLLSCGVKLKSLGFVSVNVYAAGIYVDPDGAKAKLEGWWKRAGGGQSAGSLFFDAMLSDAAGSFFARALHLIFARDVTAGQVKSSLEEKFKQAVGVVAFDRFCQVLFTAMGQGLKKGESLTYFWCAPDVTRIFVRGKVAGDVQDPKVGRVLLVGFLGDEPNCPEAKEAAPKAAAALFA